MMAKMTKTTSKSSTTTIIIPNKPPSTVCSGFIDVHGIWNNGFACPIKNFVQYFCCGSDNDHHCCPSDRSLTEINYSYEPIYISGQYQPSDNFIIGQSINPSLNDHSNIINKQFEQFQTLFLPIFLLTSSILFLIGIAIWFWLYKHKEFYAMEQEDLNQRNRVIKRPSLAMCKDSLTKKRDSINLTMQQQSRRVSYPSTEV